MFLEQTHPISFLQNITLQSKSLTAATVSICRKLLAVAGIKLDASLCVQFDNSEGQKFAANGYTVAAVKFLLWSVMICRKEIGWVGSRDVP